LLTQIPNSEKELNTQKEFIQKFEEALVKVQETAAEAMNENSLAPSGNFNRVFKPRS